MPPSLCSCAYGSANFHRFVFYVRSALRRPIVAVWSGIEAKGTARRQGSLTSATTSTLIVNSLRMLGRKLLLRMQHGGARL